MDLTLIRKLKTAQSTIGDLGVNGVHECFTLEPANPIPADSYLIAFYLSPKHDYYVPLLQDVPGHTMIEIHPGDFPKDTLDCILVGQNRGPDYVGNSLLAFIHLMLKHLIPAVWFRKELLRIVITEDFEDG
jgi:hypothetical protein